MVSDGARAAGRDPQAIGICTGAVTVVDEDGDLARAMIRPQVAPYLPVVALLDPTVSVDPELLERMGRLVDEGDDEAASARVGNDILDRFAFAGTPADIVERCEALFEGGATRIDFGTPHGTTPERGLRRLLGERVLPASPPARA